jgi:hypothetical protein
MIITGYRNPNLRKRIVAAGGRTTPRKTVARKCFGEIEFEKSSINISHERIQSLWDNGS